MSRDTAIAIKDKDGFYYCGLNAWDSQIRKAKLYHSATYAKQVINEDRYKHREAFMVKVEIKEV